MTVMAPQNEVIKHSVYPWNEAGSFFPLHTALVRIYFDSTSYAGGGGGANSPVLYLQGVTFQANRQVQPVTELGSWKLYNVPLRTMGTLSAQRVVASTSFTGQVGRYFKKIEIKAAPGAATMPTLTLYHGRIANAGISMSVGQAVMMENVTFVGDVADWGQP